MNSVLLLGSSSFTNSLRSQIRGLMSLSVTTAETPPEAVSLIDRLSPDIVIIQKRMLQASSVLKTLGQPQSAYVIVIEIKHSPTNSIETLVTLQLDKTAQALESGADAYLWLLAQNQFSESKPVPIELAPVTNNYPQSHPQSHTQSTRAVQGPGHEVLSDRVPVTTQPVTTQPVTTQPVTAQSEHSTPQHPSAFALTFQANQCRLIQAHIQIGLSRAQRYRDLSRINDWLSAVALVDALTQISNRRAFDLELPNQIKMARQKQTPLSLMVLDIDYFKSVNDRFGHLVGDDMLKQLAKRLMSNMRFYDTPFRYGGEEFIITLNNTELAEGNAIANRLCQQIANEPFQLNQPINGLTEIQMTVSIGIAELQPDDSEQGRSLVDRADKNLLQAKTSGRNKVVAY